MMATGELKTVPASGGSVVPYPEPFPGAMTALVNLAMSRQHRLQPALTVGAALAAMSAWTLGA
jgi:hypothetical protein